MKQLAPHIHLEIAEETNHQFLLGVVIECPAGKAISLESNTVPTLAKVQAGERKMRRINYRITDVPDAAASTLDETLSLTQDEAVEVVVVVDVIEEENNKDLLRGRGILIYDDAMLYGEPHNEPMLLRTKMTML